MARLDIKKFKAKQMPKMKKKKGKKKVVSETLQLHLCSGLINQWMEGGGGILNNLGDFFSLWGSMYFLLLITHPPGAISTYLHLQPGLILTSRQLVSRCPVSVCLKAVGMNGVRIPGIVCVCVCVCVCTAKEAEIFCVWIWGCAANWCTSLLSPVTFLFHTQKNPN